MVMKLTPVGIVVFIPQRFTENSPSVRKFIAEGLEQLGHRVLPQAHQLTPDTLRSMVDHWSEVMGIYPQRVTVRDMYRKWGSCSSKGNITLNTALCRVSPELAEYVVVHELAHLRVFNHGKEFKALMSDHLPDWRDREQRLNALLADQSVD